MALHHLIFDGVLERYPALKIIASHGGGFLSAYSGRIDHAWGARTDYPYDMGEYDPIGHIASVASFSEADRAAIAGGNAKALFGFQGPGRWQRGSPTL